jgi:hypothetical protein
VAMEQLVAAVSASDSSHAMRAMGVHGGRCALPLCVLCGHVVVYLCASFLWPLSSNGTIQSDDVARGRVRARWQVVGLCHGVDLGLRELIT